MKLCLIIPCFNEEKRLDQNAFLKFFKEYPHINFLFINDGSLDQTLDILDLFSTNYEQVHFIDLSKNIGKAAAVREGFLHLSTKNSYTHLGYWDADLATPLNQIIHFESALQNNQYDLVMGSRILRLGGNIIRKTHRHILGRFFASVASFALSIPVYDTQCGAKIFSIKTARLIFRDPFTSYWIFDVELLFRLKNYYSSRNDMLEKVYELPLTAWKDIEGSKLCLLDFLKAPLELIKIYRRYH